MILQETGQVIAVSGAPGAAFWRFPFVTGLLIALVAAIWFNVARSVFIHEDDMEQPSRVGQLYGYTVCLIAVLIGAATIGSILEKVVTLASPGAALEGEYSQPSLTSFEAYRATRDRGRWLNPTAAATVPTSDTVSTTELRARYEALRSDRLGHERQAAIGSLITSVVGLALAIVLFIVHWRWLGQPLTRKQLQPA